VGAQVPAMTDLTSGGAKVATSAGRRRWGRAARGIPGGGAAHEAAPGGV